ncbi:MAG: hypothetical protein FRX49_09771, partial [Trebouxia sp. A1-2]
ATTDHSTVGDTIPVESLHPPLLDRAWLLKSPNTGIRKVALEIGQLLVVQDDLLHPILGGNKLRKLDALLPEVKASGCTDLLTCGGLQSAHTAAVAAACAEQGIRAHLLVRGERPAVPTGFHLLARMYGQVTYVKRSEYADRKAMMTKHANLISRSAPPSSKLHVLPEGGCEPAALLGCIRLVRWLAQPEAVGPRPLTLIVDCGTGTTAIGLALGMHLAGLQWRVRGVMLAGPLSYYHEQQTMLTSAFAAKYMSGTEVFGKMLPLDWVERPRPRRFGKVFREDVIACQQAAQEHGILVDPIYSLAAWEAATQALQVQQSRNFRVVMLHTGGALGLQGVAQRYPDWF